VRRAAAIGALSFVLACGRGGSQASNGILDAQPMHAQSAVVPSSVRPGMVWIPAGVLRAGTPIGRTPRVAEEELPGTELKLSGYYIDVLPYPNEAAAIPTTNVARDDAAHLCEVRGKRLCTELEWEHACKGPENSTYEDGDVYHASTCVMGVAPEQAARRPSGQLLTCRSGFGVRDMHGGVYEWTDGPWGRGSLRDLGVLRGGNAVAGEIAARCANALARAPGIKSPTMGFRCCAGQKNEAKVDLTLTSGPPLERSMSTAELAAPLLRFAEDRWTNRSTQFAPFSFVHAFRWRPVPNEELVVASGCVKEALGSRCGLVVGRAGSPWDSEPPAVDVLASVDSGFEAAEVAEVGDARHLRLKARDSKSAYLQDFTYSFGRVEMGPVQR
jgi:formylglycine-generating enzyme